MKEQTQQEVPLTEVLPGSGVRYHRALDAIHAGLLRGRKDPQRGRWVVDVASFRQFVATHVAPVGA